MGVLKRIRCWVRGHHWLRRVYQKGNVPFMMCLYCHAFKPEAHDAD